MIRKQRVSHDVEVGFRKGLLGATGDEDVFGPRVRHESNSILDGAVLGSIACRLYVVNDLSYAVQADGPVESVSLELLHVPCAVDVQVGAELQEPFIGDDERAALNGEKDKGSLVEPEVLRE